jgi:hypothetical protein
VQLTAARGSTFARGDSDVATSSTSIRSTSLDDHISASSSTRAHLDLDVAS